MKILLINPEVPETFWGFRNALKLMAKKSALPPLGLLTVAAILPDEWDKRLIDMSVSGVTDSDILWADYIFVTGMMIQRESADDIIARCQRLSKPVVAGGPLFTSLPEEYLHVDHLVLKEAEETLGRFIADLGNGCARKIYNTHDKADLHETPIPNWDLIDMNEYASMCVQFSRGCPFNCDFCDVTTLFGHRMRTKSSEQVIDELESLYRRGWRGNVFFVDDNFIGNKTILRKEILPAITEWMNRRGRPFTFNTQASINLSDDPDLMEAMVQAGFDCVFVGIETPIEKALSECNKVQNQGRDLLDCVSKIQQSGMQVQAGFILGFDSDNASVFENLIHFIQDSGIVTAMVGLLNAPRGTKLYERLAREQRLVRVATGDNTDCSINFRPKMGLENLLCGYQDVIQTIYSQEQYCNRILTFFRNYQAPPKKGEKTRLPDIATFGKSILHIGILNRGRRHYWRLIWWALRRPQYLQMAVTFSLYGYHFRKINGAFQGRIESLVNEERIRNTG